MKNTTLPVALIQERAIIDQGSGDADANLAVIEQRVGEAAKQGAKLVLLQELHNGAYFCQHESVSEFDLAETIPGPSSERLAKLARQHGVVLVSSLFEKRATGLYHNTAVVFDSDGSTAGKYRKMHIPDDPGFYEKFYFTPGDLGFEPIDTSVGRLGLMVCWDQWYPEGARLMALAGAELLLYPTAIGSEPDHPDFDTQPLWQHTIVGHAIANGLFVVVPNRYGTEGLITFCGSSFIAGRHPCLIIGTRISRSPATRAIRQSRRSTTSTTTAVPPPVRPWISRASSTSTAVRSTSRRT